MSYSQSPILAPAIIASQSSSLEHRDNTRAVQQGEVGLALPPFEEFWQLRNVTFALNKP